MAKDREGEYPKPDNYTGPGTGPAELHLQQDTANHPTVPVPDNIGNTDDGGKARGY